MNQPLSRILYCSKNLIPGNDHQQTAVLSGILTTARQNNAAVGVTGALLYNSGYFAQVLEGPRAAIETVFERIQRDERHSDVTILDFAESAHRDFAEWSMAHVKPMSGPETVIANATILRAIAAPNGSGSDVLDLLRSLVNQDD